MKVVFLIAGFVFCLLQCGGKAEVAQNSRNDSVERQTDVSPTPKAVPGGTANKQKNSLPTERKMDKETLAKRVEPADEIAAEIIRAESSRVEQMETPFLRNGAIFKVSKFAPTRTITIFVGVVGDDYTELIGGNPEKYFEFVKKAGGASGGGGDARKTYVLNFLEVTKPGGKRLQILESIDDVRQRPNLKDDEKQKFAEFRDKYESVVRPVKQGEAGAYEVYAVKDQDLVRFRLTVKPDGVIENQETVLEKNLLIPYAM